MDADFAIIIVAKNRIKSLTPIIEKFRIDDEWKVNFHLENDFTFKITGKHLFYIDEARELIQQIGKVLNPIINLQKGEFYFTTPDWKKKVGKFYKEN